MNDHGAPGAVPQCCGNCHFRFQNGQDLHCRRHPPQQTILVLPAPAPRVNQIMQVPYAGFPPVKAHEWCGDWGVEAARPVVPKIDFSRLQDIEAQGNG